MKPALLVDVDGVLNLFGHCWPRDAYDHLDSLDDVDDDRLQVVFEADGGQGLSYIIQVPAGTTERIRRLEEVFECIWATTWEHQAKTELSPILGFGLDWEVIEVMSAAPFLEDGAMAKTWKLPKIQWWARENKYRKAAWIDDDLGSDVDRWAGRHGDFLAVRTDPCVGLTDEQVETLLSFAGLDTSTDPALD